MFRKLLTTIAVAVCAINPTTLTVKAEEETKLPAPVEPDWDPHFEFVEGDGYYWYENGKKQGAPGDPLNIWDTQYEKTERGREIYDPATDAWYWLDACYNGRKAENKECWFPYIFQGEDPGSTDGKWVRYDYNGGMIKGWCIDGNHLYYYDYTTGAMAKGIWTFKDLYTYDPNNDKSIIYVRVLFNRDTGILILDDEAKKALSELNLEHWECYDVQRKEWRTLADYIPKEDKTMDQENEDGSN